MRCHLVPLLVTALVLAAQPTLADDVEAPVAAIERSLTLAEKDLAAGRIRVATEQLTRVRREWAALPRDQVAFVRATEIDDRIARLRTTLSAAPVPRPTPPRPIAPARPAPKVSQDRIDLAIKKGVAALIQLQRPAGHWSWMNQAKGPTALALLALLRSDVPPHHPAIRRGLAFIEKQQLSGTYEAALVCMMLQALSDAKAPKGKAGQRRCWLNAAGRKLFRSTAGAIVAAERDGAWSYLVGGPIRSGSVDPGRKRGGVPKGFPAGIGRMMRIDHSNTQYAVLGLRAAAMCGIPIKPAVWRRVLEHFLKTQQTRGLADGPTLSNSAEPTGWGYVVGQGPTATMTSAGAVAVIIAADELTHARSLAADRRAAAANAVKGGLTWLGSSYPIRDTGNLDGYLLYGIERVGVLARVDMLGPHDWYQDGAALYVERQAADGSWDGRYRPVVETAFALLFLRRATKPTTVLEISRPTPSAGERPR